MQFVMATMANWRLVMTGLIQPTRPMIAARHRRATAIPMVAGQAIRRAIRQATRRAIVRRAIRHVAVRVVRRATNSAFAVVRRASR